MINVADYVEAARAKVAPERWCYFEGGAGDEVSLRANVAAYGRWRFRPRMLVDVSEISLATTLLGTTVAMPLGIAPFAMQRLLDPDGEAATARAAAAASVLLTVSSLTSRRHAEIAAAADGPRWLQLYVLRDRQATSTTSPRRGRPATSRSCSPSTCRTSAAGSATSASASRRWTTSPTRTCSIRRRR